MGVSHSQRPDSRHRSYQHRKTQTSKDSKLANSLNKASLHSMGNLKHQEAGWSPNPQHAPDSDEYFLDKKHKKMRLKDDTPSLERQSTTPYFH